MPIDFSSDVGKVRLRIGDVSDLPFLPDEVINNTIKDSSGNLPNAARTCAQYILAQLAFKSHKKMVQLEIWGAEAYQNYRDFLVTTVTNPSFMSFVPIPYGSTPTGDQDPIKDFMDDWNNNWNSYTVDQNMDLTSWGTNVGW